MISTGASWQAIDDLCATALAPFAKIPIANPQIRAELEASVAKAMLALLGLWAATSGRKPEPPRVDELPRCATCNQPFEPGSTFIFCVRKHSGEPPRLHHSACLEGTKFAHCARCFVRFEPGEMGVEIRGRSGLFHERCRP